MNKKYVVTGIYKYSAWYGDRKELVGHWVWLDPSLFESRPELGKDWMYAAVDTTTHPKEEFEAVYGIKCRPLTEYKKSHPDMKITKAKVKSTVD